jgi:hypothetical protein
MDYKYVKKYSTALVRNLKVTINLSELESIRPFEVLSMKLYQTEARKSKSIWGTTVMNRYLVISLLHKYSGWTDPTILVKVNVNHLKFNRLSLYKAFIDLGINPNFLDSLADSDIKHMGYNGQVSYDLKPDVNYIWLFNKILKQEDT